MRVEIRPARAEEIPLLRQALKADEEQVEFERTVTHVAEVDGEVAGFISARLVWAVEPLKLLRDDLPQNTKRRVVYGLARANEAWLADRARNRSGIYEYICRTTSTVFQKLARHWGCMEFPRAKFFRRSL